MVDTKKYKKIFLSEADEKILELNTALLALEKNPSNTSSAAAAMRAAHTLKSSAAAMDYISISHLAHSMEDLFEGVRLEKKSIQPEAIDTLFEAIDTLSLSIKNLKKNQKEIDTAVLVNKLKEVNKRVVGFRANKNRSASKIELTRTPNKEIHDIDRVETIKVDVEVLDRLMNLTEELLVEKMQLSEIVRHLEKVSQKKGESLESKAKTTEESDLNVKKLPDLKKSLENLNRLLANLQYNVTESRMVPLSQIFDRFPRMVRDLAKEQNKKINLEISGADIELDRSVIDSLGEPLIHLLKNSIDHGISKDGTLLLSAERKRDKVIVGVKDSGEGINWQVLAEVAVRRGILSPDKSQDYLRKIQNSELKIQDPEFENLLFHPELSTSEYVTETSGRGIGLSIVKQVTESLGGKVSFESGSDGTAFSLELPLTLAIIQALLIKVSDQVFALPFSQIDRSVRVSKKNIKKVFDREVAVVDNEDVPMIRLDQRFGFDKKMKSLFYSEEELHKIKHVLRAELLVISKAGGRQIGVVVDELISEQDIVVKPLKGIMKQPKGFAGITLLGDGKPALILDISTLV
jgi:two-component system, chemotaxis family, sensor kinase CheA